MTVWVVLVWLGLNPSPIDFTNAGLGITYLGTTKGHEFVAIQLNPGNAIALKKKLDVVMADKFG